MKTEVIKIVNAYKVLGVAKTTTLETADVLSIIKARRAMRTIVEDYEAFAKDAGEKLKPENYDELVAIEQKGDEATPEEKALHQRDVIAYRNAVAEAISAEFSKEVEVELPTLSDDALAKLVKENGWSVGALDELSILFA